MYYLTSANGISEIKEGLVTQWNNGIQLFRLDYAAAKNLWCWRKTLESSLNCKEIKPVNSKGNQSWIFIGRTDAEAETPILWSPDGKNWLTGKDPDAGKDRRWKKGTTEDEMVGWYHWLDDMSLSKLWELVRHREAWRAAVYAVAKSQTRLSNWPENPYLSRLKQQKTE